MEKVTRRLAKYIVATGYDDLPVAVIHEAERAFVNWIGCALGGAREPSVDISVAFHNKFSGPRDATVIGRHERLDIFRAAFANGLASSVHSFNDTHFSTVTHPTSPVAAALFALAEYRPISGRDFLTALLLGNEIQCRVASMIAAAPANCHIGISTVGVTGVIGAAVAVGKALRLDAQHMAWAIGIAANQAAGLREAHATMSSHFTPGHSARSGLEAALLAEAGYECAETMLEGEKGYANVFSENPQFHVSTEDLGTRFEAVSVSYKPYPCGFVIHPVIDACLALSTEDGVTPAQIARLDLTCNPMLTALTDRVHPTNRRNALVSFQHWAAVALAEGAAGIPQGGDDRLTDKVIAALRTRITTTCDTRIGREAVIARITLNDGRTIEHYVRDCVGSIGRPMTDNELSVKFQSQAQTLLPEVAADNLMARCWDIAAVDNVGDIAPTLVVA